MGNPLSRCMGTHAIDGSRTANSNGRATASPLPRPQQPVLSPTDWLLTNQELTSSRGGIPRSELAPFTTGDKVDTFASTDSYFRALLADLDAADVASVWISGWSLNHTLPLDPTATSAHTTTLQAIVERAVGQRGVHVRALVWANLFERKECLATRDWMNSIAPKTHGSALMLFDNRLPHHVSSHHQKSVVIQRKDGEYIAFLGGVDITANRWDTLTHDQKPLRIASGWQSGNDGWIDAAVRVEGAAARDVAATFATRWNSKVKSANCWKEELLDFENPDAYDLVPMPPPPAVPSTANSSSSPRATLHPFVQIVRTFSPLDASKIYPELAPAGELSLLQSRLKAIGLARNLIYIEDQYLFLMPQLQETLHKALQTQPALRVVVVVQRPTVTTQSKYAGYEKLVFEMASPLLRLFPRRFQIYTTKTPRNLYIHSKLVVVDDVFLSIGSANWNRRSMTSDSELAASIVDTQFVASVDVDDHGKAIQVGKTVREFRLLKWREMTGRSVETLRALTIAQCCEALETASAAGNDDRMAIVERLQVENKWEFAVFHDEFTLHVVDPDDLNHAQHNSDSGDEDAEG